MQPVRGLQESKEESRYGDVEHDPAAFERLYHAHHEECSRMLARRFRRVRDAWRIPSDEYDHAVRHAVSLAFATVRLDWAKYDPNRSVVGWLYTVAHRRLHKDLRYHLRLARHTTALDEAAGQGSTFLPALLLRHSVAQTLARMRPGQARALILHYVDGWPVRDVARQMGTTETAVQSLLQRGRGSFRRLADLPDAPAASVEEPHAG